MIGTLGRGDFKLIFQSLGKVVAVASFSFLIPLAVAYYLGEWEQMVDFAISFAATLVFGVVLWQVFKTDRELRIRHAIATTALCYPVISFFSALPLLKVSPTFIDAYFEAVSGWTTTGLSTMLENIDHFPLSINLWRHFMQYLGGLGIVVMSLVILSRAGTGIEATAFYTAEGRAERIGASIIGTVKMMWAMYLGLFMVGVIALHFAGMSWFDSICHSMSGFSTGGFSTHSQSIAFYKSYLVEVVALIIMIIGSTNFALIYSVSKGNLREFARNIEVRTFLLATIILAVPAVLWTNSSIPESLRLGVFQVISSLTTTGWSNYASPAIILMPFVQMLLVLGMIIGASSGSTGGGVKRIRIALLIKSIWWNIQKTLSPEDAVILKKFHHLKDRTIEEKTLYEMYIMISSYTLLLIFSTMISASYGYSLGNSFFEAASAIGTVGLSTGITGPGLPWLLKVLYIIDMWAGRLEVLPVLVFFASFKGLLKG
jgi:trk system potassium uptake protein TrkH